MDEITEDNIRVGDTDIFIDGPISHKLNILISLALGILIYFMMLTRFERSPLELLSLSPTIISIITVYGVLNIYNYAIKKSKIFATILPFILALILLIVIIGFFFIKSTI